MFLLNTDQVVGQSKFFNFSHKYGKFDNSGKFGNNYSGKFTTIYSCNPFDVTHTISFNSLQKGGELE